MIDYLSKKFVLSHTGAKNLVKACISCTFSYLAIALSMGILYSFTNSLLLPMLENQSVEVNCGIYLLAFVIVTVLIYVAHYIQYNMTFYNTYIESAKMRISMAEHLRKMPLSFFGKRNLSDLTTTILTDVTGMEQALSHFIPEFIGSIISTTILSIVMLFFNFKMAIAAVWCVPVSFLLIILAKRKLLKIGYEDKQLKLKRTEKIQEGLESMKDLKATHYTHQYLEEVDKVIDDNEKSQIKSEITNAIFVISAQMVLKLGIVTTVLAGVYYLASHQISLSVFLMFLIVASRLYDPLNGTLQNLAAMISCQSKIDRLSEIENYPIQTGQESFDPDYYDIEFNHVSFGYDKNQAVIHDVSFTARQGEITALIGQSGGGKSTIAKLASRFWDADKGRITVGGIDISQVDPEVLLSKYAIVFQDVVLFNASILENIRIGKKDASDKEVLAAAKLACCDEFVHQMEDGYQTVIGENGARLSGGQRQRISIARALLKDAPIIVLDEATASLDVENETFVQKALSSLIKNKTVIMIAHRMRTIANADHLIVLKDGKIVEEGRPDDLMRQKGIYYHMAKIQGISQQWKI